ncbi:MAG: glycoside hydrolase family 28 protein [Chitinophagaceae bacterium]|nr:glycoside hydrolase family 28 protein [Chitinophagaceae bacterium]
MVLLFLYSAALIAGYAQKKIYNITSYGARPDGFTNNTAAIQKAIDEASASGGGTVMVPRGRFVTGVIHIKSNVELYIHEEAVLLGSINRVDYGPSLKASALIVADNQKNISITGKGLIDGQSDLLINDIYVKLRAGELYDDEWKEFNPWHQRRPSEKNRPRIIQFTGCDKVTVKNIRLQNSTAWVQDYKSCSNIIIDSIHVFSNTFWNNDGIDLTDCKNARITNCFINAADDGICLKSSDRNSRCENIYIANCKVRSSASAVKFGTASWGGFKKITVRNIDVYDTYRSAIAIEAVDGGIMEDIDVRNINAVNTGNAVFIRLGHRNKDSVYSRMKNVYVGNIKVKVPKEKPDKGYPMEGPELRYPPKYKVDTSVKYESVSPWNNSGIDSSAVPYPHNVFPSSITGIPGHYVENVTLENIEIISEGGAGKEVNYFPADSLQSITEAISSYPEFSMFGELPAWGFYVRHVNGLTMKNIRLTSVKPDFRVAAVFDDVSRLKLDGITVLSDKNNPVIILNRVKEYSLGKLKFPSGDGKAIKVQ